MTIRDFVGPLKSLTQDVRQAEELLDTEDSQFFRRAYIRSSFATIEGVVWLIKQVCLKAKPAQGTRLIGVADFVLLSDQTYDLKGNGEPSVQTKYLKLPDNLQFTAKVVARLFGADWNLGVGTKQWDSFLKAIRVRNRITHPKSAEAMVITNNDIALCKEVSGWFNAHVHALIQTMLKNAERASEQSPLQKEGPKGNTQGEMPAGDSK